MLTSRTEPVDVELINIDKAYSHNGPLVLENFSIHIPAGDLVTVLGPSGCGVCWRALNLQPAAMFASAENR